MQSVFRDYVIILTFLAFSGLLLEVALEEVEMASYFPEFLDDLSDIRWIHAVNTRQQLEEALNGDAHMLEADVCLGTIVGRNPGLKEPIMAHPPMNESDINLHEFLSEVIKAKKRKGVKLDFKSIEIVQPALQIMTDLFSDITFPIWINADILSGPVNATSGSVAAFVFLHMSKAFFPESVLSPGWTTHNSAAVPIQERAYTWDNVVEMAVLLHDIHISQPITFPVRAAFVSRSLDMLRWLLAVVPSSTLTVFGSDRDSMDIEELLVVRSVLPKNKVYYDLPSYLDDEFRKRKDDDLSHRRVKTLDVSSSACAINQSFASDVNQHQQNGSGCVLSAEMAIAFRKPCNYSVNLSERNGDSPYDHIRGVLEFLKAPASAATSQSLIVGFGPTREQILLERNGLIHRIELSKVLNTTKLNRSRCYAFQLSFNDAIGGDEDLFLNTSFWPINCRTNEPFDPSEDAFVVRINKSVSNATRSLNVESRGDSFKVLRNIRYICKLATLPELTISVASMFTRSYYLVVFAYILAYFLSVILI